MNKSTSEAKTNRTQQDTTRNTLRIVVMFYIGYLGYSVFQGYLGNRDPWLLAAALVFFAADIVFVVLSLRQWQKKRQAAALQKETQT